MKKVSDLLFSTQTLLNVDIFRGLPGMCGGDLQV
jgi:hypothetical protein